MVEQSNTKKVLKGITSQTLVTVVLGLVEIISFSIMSRLLSQTDFGYYAAITAVVTVFASFSETGIGAALVQKKDLTQEYVNNAFTINLLFGFAISMLMVALSTPISRIVVDVSMKIPIMLMSITLFSSCLSSVSFSLMQRKMQFLRMGLINLTASVITTILAIILAVNGFGYYAILSKAILSSIITVSLSYVFVNSKFGVSLNGNIFKSIFGYSGWLMASCFFRNFAQQADKLLMGRLLSVSSLGMYNRPKEFITQISSKFNGIFDSALFPVLSGVQDDKAGIRNAYQTSLYYMNLFSAVLMLAFVFNSDLLIRIFLGEQWINIKSIFIILSISLLFNIDGRLIDCFFRSLALTKAQFIFRTIELIAQVIGIIVGSHWHLAGIAISVVVVSAAMIIFKLLFLSSRVDVSVKDAIRILLSSWRISFIYIPILFAVTIFVPCSIKGDIIILVSFCAITIVLFLFAPSVVGKRYKNEIYISIRNQIKKIFVN